MKKSKIIVDLLVVGDVYPLNPQKLDSIGKRSNIFSLNIINVTSPGILQNLLGGSKEVIVPTANFLSLAQKKSTSHFSVIVIDRRLEGNYFSIPISDKLIVVSISDLDKLNLHEGITLEMYLTRFIYAFVVIYIFEGRTIPNGNTKLVHPESVGCLFDFCLDKSDVAKFFRNPKLCEGTTALLRQSEETNKVLSSLIKEIKQLKIGVYYRIRDWLKLNPIIALIISFLVNSILSGVLTNLISSIIIAY